MHLRKLKIITTIILLLLLGIAATAQVNVRATVNRDRILIGEPISLTVEAYMPLGTQHTWISADSIPAFQINESGPVDTADNMDGKKISQTLTITSFDSGRVVIPPFELRVDDQSFYTDSIPIEVSYTSFDPAADYRDIKDIIEVVNESVRFIPWIIAAIVLISLIILGVIFFRKRTEVKAAPIVAAPSLSAYEEAMQILRELKNRGTSITVKQFYSDVNDVLRRYLSRDYGIATFERTNEELIMQLSRLQLPKEVYLGLVQSLRMSDFVKFAKYHPSEADNDQNLETVKASIEMLNKSNQRAV